MESIKQILPWINPVVTVACCWYLRHSQSTELQEMKNRVTSLEEQMGEILSSLQQQKNDITTKSSKKSSKSKIFADVFVEK